MKYILTLILIMFPFSAEALTCAPMTWHQHLEKTKHLYLGELSDKDSKNGTYEFKALSILKGSHAITKPVTIGIGRWMQPPVADVLGDRQSIEVILPLDPDKINEPASFGDCTIFPVARDGKYATGYFYGILAKLNRNNGLCRIRKERYYAGCNTAAPGNYLEVSQPIHQSALDIYVETFRHLGKGSHVVVAIYRFDDESNTMELVEEVTLDHVQDKQYYTRYTVSEKHVHGTAYLVEYKTEPHLRALRTWTNMYYH